MWHFGIPDLIGKGFGSKLLACSGNRTWIEAVNFLFTPDTVCYLIIVSYCGQSKFRIYFIFTIYFRNITSLHSKFVETLDQEIHKNQETFILKP